jgi:hypothetical protein
MTPPPAQQQVTARLALREAKFLLTLARFEEAQTLFAKTRWRR